MHFKNEFPLYFIVELVSEESLLKWIEARRQDSSSKFSDLFRRPDVQQFVEWIESNDDEDDEDDEDDDEDEDEDDN